MTIIAVGVFFGAVNLAFGPGDTSDNPEVGDEEVVFEISSENPPQEVQESSLLPRAHAAKDFGYSYLTEVRLYDNSGSSFVTFESDGSTATVTVGTGVFNVEVQGWLDSYYAGTSSDVYDTIRVNLTVYDPDDTEVYSVTDTASDNWSDRTAILSYPAGSLNEAHWDWEYLENNEDTPKFTVDQAGTWKINVTYEIV